MAAEITGNVQALQSHLFVLPLVLFPKLWGTGVRWSDLHFRKFTVALVPREWIGERPLGGCSVTWTNNQARWASERTGGGGGERRLSGDPSSQAENFLPKP